MGMGDDNGGGGSDVVYTGSAEPMLVSPSNSYSDNEISVSDSRSSSCPAYTDTDYFVLLTTVQKCKQFWSKKTVLL